MYTKRQIIEAEKRSSILFDLLNDKAGCKETCLSYANGYYSITIDNEDHVAFTFNNYNQLKKNQLYLIDLLKSIDDVITTYHKIIKG